MRFDGHLLGFLGGFLLGYSDGILLGFLAGMFGWDAWMDLQRTALALLRAAISATNRRAENKLLLHCSSFWLPFES